MCVFLTLSHSLEYLRGVAGPRTVPVEIGSRYTDKEWTQKLMTLSDFIDQHILQQVCILNLSCRLCECLCVCFVKEEGMERGYLAQHHLFQQV